MSASPEASSTTPPERWAQVEAAGAAAFSQDGTTLFHLRGAGLAQIWALTLATGVARQLTRHDEKVAFLRRSPTDDRLLYGIDAGGDERQQLWLLEGDAARPLTEVPAVIHDFGAWMPGGTAIAYAANDRTEAHLDVVLHELSGARRRLFEGDGMTAVAAVSPDGATLAIVAERSTFDMSLWLVGLDGAARELPRNRPTRYQSVRWSADAGLLCLTDADDRDVLALCRLDPETGAATELAAAPGMDLEAYALSPDGTLLATIENDRGYGLLRLGPPGRERPLLPGLPAQGVAADLAFSPAGAPGGIRLAFTFSSPTAPTALWVWEAATNAARPLWQPALPARAIPFELVAWTSFDARSIPGWLALPATPAPPGGHSAVIWVHGGPAAQARGAFRADMQSLLAQGHAVLMPNVRGSTGYGRAATLSDERERRLDTVTDLAHGQAWLAARPDIDASRIAVMGQSYGGYMVLAAITEHPGLWRCAIDFYGIADFRTLLAGTGAWRRTHRADEYGDPSRQPELMQRISPLTHVDRITAPLLALHGRRDPRVPIGESEQIVTALRERQRRVTYEVFDYAGHGFVRPDDKRRVYLAVAGFLGEELSK